MSGSELFDPVIERGWRMGLSNLMRKELGAWFGTSAWWQQALLWSGLLGLFTTAIAQAPEAGLIIFYMMALIFPSIAVIIVSQEVILEEKRSGSAAWLLSKPVSRTAFVLAKLLPYSLGIMVSMILIPGTVAFLITVLMGIAPNLLLWYASLLILSLWHVFLHFLTVCLGTFYDKEGSVMGLPFLLMFFAANLSMNETTSPYGPWGLIQLALAVGTGGESSALPLVITVAILIILGATSILRFRKHEF